MKALASSSTFCLWIATATKSFVIGFDSERVVAGKDGGGSGVRGRHGTLGALRLGEGGGDGASCSGEKSIPFMVTNVELTADGNEHYWGHNSDNSEAGFKFLKNIRYCPNAGASGSYRIYGELLSPDEYRDEVTTFVEDSPDHDRVLYNIHGVNVEPEESFLYAHDFLHGNGKDAGILAIPINWRNLWGVKDADAALAYGKDRTESAPRAGRQLAARRGAFESVVPVSVLCHGLGGDVLRIMARHVETPVHAFDRAYLVAADARADLFGTAVNPAAPASAAPPDEAAPAAPHHLDASDGASHEDGGYYVVQIASHVHVVWSGGDRSLVLREAFPGGEGGRAGGGDAARALGKYGVLAEELMTLDYFKKRVTFHDFSEEGGSEHDYQFHNAAVHFYVQCEGGEVAAKREKQAVLKMD